MSLNHKSHILSLLAIGQSPEDLKISNNLVYWKIPEDQVLAIPDSFFPVPESMYDPICDHPAWVEDLGVYYRDDLCAVAGYNGMFAFCFFFRQE